MIMERSMVAGFEYFCSQVKLSKCSSMVFPWAPRFFCLGVLAVLVTLTQRRCGVEGTTFSFNGFRGLADVNPVQADTQVWTYNADNYSISLTAANYSTYITSVAGRFLYPTPVQMKEPGATAASSFSTSFIFQILNAGAILGVGPGLAFIVVPDNITIGANLDYMGLITTDTGSLSKNYASDNHTVGVEFDTHLNEEFNDPNDNHICIDVTSMNSTASNTFVPTIPLTTTNPDRFQQVWIDYFQEGSRMDIYHAAYGVPKPASPLGSQLGVDLSVLKEYMYVGFSAAVGYESDNLHTILAWSFSNEAGTLAPDIRIGRDAGPPPPPASPPPARPPVTSPQSGPVPAPDSTFPPSPSPPAPIVPPQPNSAPSPSPPDQERNPPPPGATGSLSPSSKPAANSHGLGGPKIAGISVGVVVLIVILVVILAYEVAPPKSPNNSSVGEVAPPKPPNNSSVGEVEMAAPTAPTVSKLRIFIIHTGGGDGSEKNFPKYLYRELKKDERYEVFIDSELRLGTPFPEELMQELQKFEVGKGVGIIVVTKASFEKSWPMIELVKFLDMQEEYGASRVRVLPLFYRMKPDEIEALLNDQVLEKAWAKLSNERHHIDLEKYRVAVRQLRKQNGVLYAYEMLGHDEEYTELILKRMSTMYEEMHAPEDV